MECRIAITWWNTRLRCRRGTRWAHFSKPMPPIRSWILNLESHRINSTAPASPHEIHIGLTLPTSRACIAGFQTCCIADFQVGRCAKFAGDAGLETCDTADLEVCATILGGGYDAFMFLGGARAGGHQRNHVQSADAGSAGGV